MHGGSGGCGAYLTGNIRERAVQTNPDGQRGQGGEAAWGWRKQEQSGNGQGASSGKAGRRHERRATT